MTYFGVFSKRYIMNESQTKHDFIDPALKEAGWGVVEGSRIRLEFPITQGRLVNSGVRSCLADLLVAKSL